MNEKRILLIDDDQDIAELLTAYLATEGYQLTCCYDGLSGLEQIRTGQFDLVLLDVMLPGLTGFEVLTALGGSSVIPILMLTAKGDDNDRILGLNLGADDYLAKPFNHCELLARINAIFRRIAVLAKQDHGQQQLSVNQVTLYHGTRTVTCHGQELELTGTEYQILHCLMEHQGQIISKEFLYQSVLGRRLTAFDRSIDMHVSNIRRKLLPLSESDKIKTVRGAGYLFLAGTQ
jgi:two-component system, OmpR family, response regulator CpxR